MCGAPRACTYTGRSGQRSTRRPLAPAWSKWMWVASTPRGSKSSPSFSSSVPTDDSGPGSTRKPSTSQQQITRSMPTWTTSIGRIAGQRTPVVPVTTARPRARQRARAGWIRTRRSRRDRRAEGVDPEPAERRRDPHRDAELRALHRIPGMSEHRLPERDRPWMMRTYAGHSTAKKSNELYRGNLAKGQTGLSIAFDLPTQTGYDADDELSRGEVGKVGVPVAHKGDMHALLDGIPLDKMNTSMTINATAAWLLALYIVAAEENGVDASVLAGTTQNDIIKEYLSRGTYAFPPAPSMRLIGDMVAYTIDEVPKWNPINVCSYHLQEAGATPVQEIAFAMATAQAVLDEVRPRVGQEKMGAVFGRISFFVNAGVRFVEEHAKLRAMSVLWEELGRERYGVEDPKHLRFRYGVQVNSLGLTESQPENNVQRIVLEALAVTLGRSARARAVQLPAWNEALGLPRPWDQQWSLRIQQVLAFETDLL